MTDPCPLPRLKPDPIPAIHPVPEYRADATLMARYADTRTVLGVPWMGVVAMAFAHYPNFYAALWRGLRPLALSREFADACAELRQQAETEAATLGPAPLGGQLAGLGYAPREIAEIGDTIGIFARGNQPYLLMATLARLLLEGAALSPEAVATPLAVAAPEPRPPVLMEPHHADAPTRDLFADIRARLGLPFVNTDYRALARWPSYFAAAWEELRAHPGTAAWDRATDAVHRAAVATALALPNPGRATPDDLARAAEQDAPAEEILAVVRLFQWLLPGLTLNVAYLRAQLDGGT